MTTVNASPAARERALREAEEAHRARGCFERMAHLAASGLLAGAFLGAVQASWNEASHVGVARSSKWSVLAATSKGVGKMSAMMGLVAVTFAAGECAAQTARADKQNTWVNQSIGGAAAGLAVGAMTRSLSGAVGSAAALALLCGVFASMPIPTESEKKLNKA